MCMVFKEELDVILLAINQYVKANNIHNPTLSNHLKDYLAELKDLSLISHCGCDGLFELKIVDSVVLVYIEIGGKIIKFVINNSPYHELSCHSEASDKYDDFL